MGNTANLCVKRDERDQHKDNHKEKNKEEIFLSDCCMRNVNVEYECKHCKKKDKKKNVSEFDFASDK